MKKNTIIKKVMNDSMIIASDVIFETRSGDESVRMAGKGRNKTERNYFVK